MNINKNSLNTNSVFIIAGIGTSHNGDIKKAEDMITAAAEAGVDCVKFQYVIAREIVHPKTGKVLLPGGSITLYKRFLQLEQEPDFYAELKQITEKYNLGFLCTPFGLESAENLIKLGVDKFKIASPELNHYPLLEKVKDYPLILSTGVSTLGDIEKALSYVQKEAALLHCITSYPAPEEEYNLKVISSLRAIFGIPVGVSDHSKDPILVPVLSTAMGGSIIEKHFTLSRDDGGLDDPIAVNPNELSQLCKEVRKAEQKESEETIKYLNDIYGNQRIKAILGTGIKKLAPSEAANYRTTNRSVMAVADIKKGTIFTNNNIALLRSEKQLSPGLDPELFNKIINRKAIADIRSGTGITWDCF